MSDALTIPADNTRNSQPQSDTPDPNTTATKFLNEIHEAMTGPLTYSANNDGPGAVSDGNYVEAQQDAWNDLLNLQNTPQQQATLDAIAGKIESHDPSLGLVQGTVERDKTGAITGFSFTDPQQEATYAQSLNAYELQGHTMKEAVANDGTNFLTAARTRGQLEISASGVAQVQ